MKYIVPILAILIIVVSILVQDSFAYTQLTNPINYTGNVVTLTQSNLNFNKTTPFSLQFKMLRDSTAANECMICKVPSTDFFGTGWNVWDDGQAVNFQINGKNYDMLRIRAWDLNDNKPQNILFTYNGNGSAKGMTLKVNATNYPTYLVADNLNSSSQNNLNVLVGGLSTSTYLFSGKITNLIIYSGILSGKQTSLNDNVGIQDSVLVSVGKKVSSNAFNATFGFVRDSTIANECILCKYQGSFDAIGFGIWTDGQLINLSINGKNSDILRVRTTQLLNDNDRQNMIISYNGSGKASGIIFKLNGTTIPFEVVSDNLISSFANNFTLNIGTMSDGSQKYTGSIINMVYQNSTYKSSPSNFTSTNAITTGTTSICIVGYIPIGFDFSKHSVVCIPSGASIIQYDGSNEISIPAKYMFGFGTKYADDTVAIDNRNASAPYDVRLMMSGIRNDASGKCLSESIMFSDNENVDKSHFNQLLNIWYDNCAKVFHIGDYTPLGNNNFSYKDDLTLDKSGNVNIVSGHLYVQGQLVK